MTVCGGEGRSRRWRPVRAIGLACTLAGVAAADAASPPQRIVSLNPCVDAILVQVADPSQITALSRWSRDPGQSTIAPIARRFPFTWGTGEEIVALRPDLLLNGGAGDPAFSRMLARLHIVEADLPVPSTVAESLAQVRRIAALSGHPDRGEALVRRLDAALAAATPPPGAPRLRALIYESHGLASGSGTLMDALLRRTGFDNLAPRYGLRRSGDVPLERLLIDPPQVLLAGRLAPGQPAWADRVLSHPALRRLAPRMLRESFPEVLMFCGGPVMIPAVQALARARTDALAGRSR